MALVWEGGLPAASQPQDVLRHRPSPSLAPPPLGSLHQSREPPVTKHKHFLGDPLPEDWPTGDRPRVPALHQPVPLQGPLDPVGSKNRGSRAPALRSLGTAISHFPFNKEREERSEINNTK